MKCFRCGSDAHLAILCPKPKTDSKDLQAPALQTLFIEDLNMPDLVSLRNLGLTMEEVHSYSFKTQHGQIMPENLFNTIHADLKCFSKPFEVGWQYILYISDAMSNYINAGLTKDKFCTTIVSCLITDYLG